MRLDETQRALVYMVVQANRGSVAAAQAELSSRWGLEVSQNGIKAIVQRDISGVSAARSLDALKELYLTSTFGVLEKIRGCLELKLDDPEQMQTVHPMTLTKMFGILSDKLIFLMKDGQDHKPTNTVNLLIANGKATSM
jgi:hypothetical protein